MRAYPEKIYEKEQKQPRAFTRGLAATALASLALWGAPDEANGDAKVTSLLPAEPAISFLEPAEDFIVPLEFQVKKAENKQKPKPPQKSDKARLSEKILGHENVAFWSNNGADTRDVFEDLASDKPGSLTCDGLAGETAEVDKDILNFVLEVANDGNYIMVNAVTDKCHSTGSNHYEGDAVDLDCSTEASYEELETAAHKFGGENNGEVCGVSSHYHYDF